MPASGAVVLLGVAIRETANNLAVYRLHNGTDTNGEVTVPISLDPSESVRDWFGPTGLMMEGGIYPEVVSGAMEGAYFIRDWSDEGFDYDWQIP